MRKISYSRLVAPAIKLQFLMNMPWCMVYIGSMRVRKKSKLTGKMNELDIPITRNQLKRFRSGESIKKVFPKLNFEQREFLLTGVSPKEWDSLTRDPSVQMTSCMDETWDEKMEG